VEKFWPRPFPLCAKIGPFNPNRRRKLKKSKEIKRPKLRRCQRKMEKKGIPN